MGLRLDFTNGIKRSYNTYIINTVHGADGLSDAMSYNVVQHSTLLRHFNLLT